MNKIIGLGGLGVAGYSVYAMGKLADKIPNEKGYVITGLLGGAGLWFLGTGGGWTKPSKEQENLGMIGIYTFLSSAGYAASRVLLKQNPKVSLILGASVAVGFYLWQNSVKKPTESTESSNTK